MEIILLCFIGCFRTMSRNLVFVYGSLKQTQPNHHWLTDKANGEAQLRGLATTEEKFPLVVASRYNIPYVLASPGTGKVLYFLRCVLISKVMFYNLIE